MSDDRKLLIRRAGSAWIEPESSAYDNESHLQEILATDPAQIPGVDTGSLTATELLTGGGYVDVCVVGRDGSIAVVECKLASNGDRRRMVIGQVIDYAAAISMAGADAFIESWLHNTQTDLRVELDGAALATLRTNIADGHVDLCLAVDKIDDHLRRLVEYLNRVTIAEVRVTSLQLSYAKHGDVEILIPTTFGGEIADAKARKSGRSTRWTVETFLAALGTDEDRSLASDLFGRAGAMERLGRKDPLWFGDSPGGGIYLQPHGLPFAPAWLSINKSGVLMVTGTWNWFGEILHHEGYGPLASLLQLDHLGGATGRPVAQFDLDGLWAAIIECGVAINEAFG